MYVDDIIPETVYSVIKDLSDREVSLIRGEQIILDHATHPRIQRFSSVWSDKGAPGYLRVDCPGDQYILVHPTKIFFEQKESLWSFGRQLDFAPIIACLLDL